MKKVLYLFFLLAISFFCNSVTAKELKFVQFSDIDFSINENKAKESQEKSSEQYLKQAVKDINKMRDVKFVLFTGDNINKPDRDVLVRFLKTANKLNKPYYILIGNQEVLRYKHFNKNNYMRAVWLYHPQMLFKKSNYVFKPNKDFVFIVVDGVNELIPSQNGYFRKETLEWLDKKLQKYQKKKVVIVQHFPLIPPIKKTSYNTLEPEKYFRIINSYDNIVAILSGHFHVDNMIYKKGIYHISAPAFAKYPHQYKIITIDYEPKYLFSNPAEFSLNQELIQMVPDLIE